MPGRVEQLLRRSATTGTWVRPLTAVRALIAWQRLAGRRKLPSIRALDVQNLDYYRRALAAGHDVVWTSLFSPCELYAAFGIPPLCLEGVAGVLAAAAVEQSFLRGHGVEAVPNTLCTFHRVIVGVGQSGLLQRPRAVVSSSALCDGNGVSFRQLAEHHRVPFVFLHVPPEPTRDGVTYLVEQLKQLESLLEDILGRRADRRRLAEAVAKAREATTLASDLRTRRASLPCHAFRAPQVINLMFPLNAMVGSEALCIILRGLIRDVAANGTKRRTTQRPAAGRPVRILWSHIAPLYNYNPVWAVLDDGVRARVVSDECSHWDRAGLECDDDYEFIARRLIGVPQNGALAHRLERLDWLRREARADAVVHFSHWGCHQAAGAAPVMQRFFNDRGVAFLNLNGDCVDSTSASREQHVTRAEAFVESLVPRG